MAEGEFAVGVLGGGGLGAEEVDEPFLNAEVLGYFEGMFSGCVLSAPGEAREGGVFAWRGYAPVYFTNCPGASREM